jgi:hypothetical protein
MKRLGAVAHGVHQPGTAPRLPVPARSQTRPIQTRAGGLAARGAIVMLNKFPTTRAT